METDREWQLMLRIGVSTSTEPSCPVAADWSAYARGVKLSSFEQLNFPGMIYFDEFTLTKLKRNTGNYTVCQKDLCCHLTYEMSEKRTDEVYVFQCL